MENREEDCNVSFLYSDCDDKFSGAKPFECPHCDKKFRTAAHKKSHVMQHFKDGEVVRDRVRERRRRIKTGLMSADVPLQEPILITDTGRLNTVILY